MRKTPTYGGLLLTLLVLLASCEPENRQVATAAPEPVADSQVGQPADSVPTAAPVTSAIRGKEQGESAPKSPKVIRLTYDPKRSARHAASTSLEPAPERDAADQPEPEPTPAAAPDLPAGRRAQGVGALYAQFTKAPQVFAVNTEADTVLICAEGTRVAVPAGAFVDSATSQPITGPVEVRVQEYLLLADIVLNNLSTTSGDRLLETGGMLNIEATANGRPLALRPGEALGLALPRKGDEKPGMQVFGGQPRSGRQAMDWRLGAGTIEHGAPAKTWKAPTREKDRVRLKRDRSLERRLRRQTGFSAAKGEALAHRELPATERRRLTRVRQTIKPQAARQNLVEVVEISFETTRQNEVRNVRRVGGQDAQLQAAVESVIGQFATWKKKDAEGRAYRKPRRLTVYFFRQGDLRVELRAGSRPKIEHDSANLKSIVRLLAARPDQVDEGGAVELAGAYIMSISQLGWINCDRFIASPQPLVALRVRAPDADVKLILRDRRAVLPGEPTGNRLVSFMKAPAGEAVTILALRYSNGQAQIATRETTISRVIESELTFRPVTLEGLKEEIAKLGE